MFRVGLAEPLWAGESGPLRGTCTLLAMCLLLGVDFMGWGESCSLHCQTCVHVWAVTFEAAVEKPKRPLPHSSLRSFEFDLSCIIYWHNPMLWCTDHIFNFYFAPATQAHGFLNIWPVVVLFIYFWRSLTNLSVMFRLPGKPHQPCFETGIMRCIFLCLSVGNCLSVLGAVFIFILFPHANFLTVSKSDLFQGNTSNPCV